MIKDWKQITEEVVQHRPLHGFVAKWLKGDGLWLCRQILLPWPESLLCFVWSSMSLERRVELLARLGQGSWSMVEEEESGRRRMERVEWRWIEEREGINYRLTHSIEGWSQTTCRGELENSDCRVAFQYWAPVAAVKTLGPRMCDLSTTVSLCAHPHGSETKRQRGIKINVIVGLNSIHGLEAEFFVITCAPHSTVSLGYWKRFWVDVCLTDLDGTSRENMQSWLHLGIISLMTWATVYVIKMRSSV